MRYDEAFYADSYHSALMTTFAFDPTVFDNVVLVALRSRGCRNIAVIADRDMLNQTLRDVGAPHAAGVKYHMAKRAVAGSFHPKIVLQLGQDGGRLMVGSANLTGPGLVSNFEGVSSLTVTAADRTAAPLLAAAFAYFERHCDPADPAMQRALARARRSTPWLAETEAATEVVIKGTKVALLTEMEEGGIAAAMSRFIDGDTIQDLVVVSPYWDASLDGLNSLRELLGNPQVSLVVDRDEQDFDAETFLNLDAARLHSSEKLPQIAERKLHAKLVVARGQKADYVLAGSANASKAGLLGQFGGPGNAEACLIRAEDPGSSIARLGLGQCLTSEMPLADLRLRRRDETGSGSSARIVDGGMFCLDGSRLRWTPPTGRPSEGASISLHDHEGIEVHQGMPVLSGEGWVIELASGSSQPRQAIVHFPDGEISIPSPVAVLSDLERNARAANPSQVDRILGEIEQSLDVDFDMLRLALMIDGDARRTPATKADRQTLKVRNDEALEENNAPTYTSEEFRRVAVSEDAGGRADARHGPLGDLRDIINRRLGLFEQHGAEEVDALSAIIGGGTPPPTRPSSAATSKARPPRSFHDAKQRAKKLVEHVNRTCQVLREPDVDALSYGNSIRLRLLVMAVLREACPAGVAPGPDHGLSSTDPAQSWVRMLGRLMAEVVRSLAKSETDNLDDEGLEALALFQFAASLASEVAVRQDMNLSVARQLQGINGAMAKAIQEKLTNTGASNDKLAKTLAALSSHYAHLSTTAAMAQA
ncbi:hypothetical protein CEW88_08500 [Alloyangia pacifica]|uniref:Phospholipase D-like domain-containing protein n=1 Tax=Alloyangia pacifica TaxID=311180 RepID=A0A2U8HCR1_9RHOB|nr:hypothetical protein [Alloyangia pacifica]AWI83717.1 hypothetical protein CEW88_08500 [Alloyangia pacifica]